jgi:hypothetical protein
VPAGAAIAPPSAPSGGAAKQVVVDGRHIARDAIEARYRKALTTVSGPDFSGTSGMSEPATLHRRIYAELEGRILSGGWAPGSRIPFEHELTAQYGCSRMTVNKAISELAVRGLVTRRRRAGTFVAQPRAHAAILAIPDLGAEIADRGQTYGFPPAGAARARTPAIARSGSWPAKAVCWSWSACISPTTPLSLWSVV